MTRPEFTVDQLAEPVGGTVEGDGSRLIDGVAAVHDATSTELTFVVGGKYLRALESSAAGAVIVPSDLELPATAASVIRVAEPQLAFGRLVSLFHPDVRQHPGIASTATIGHGVSLGDAVTIGAYARIGAGARIGRETTIGPFTIVEGGVTIGEGCAISHGCSVLRGARLGDRVTVHPGARISTDGYGYAPGPEGPEKVPQIGGCVIGDDVEIGANSTIDRGALGDTVIGRGTKIDNLVHIAHNVEVGENCLIVAQVGIAGSVTIGSSVQFGGQAGIAGHLTIGDGARIGAQAGVIGDVPAGATYSGYPARPHRDSMRASGLFYRLPELFERLHALEASTRERHQKEE